MLPRTFSPWAVLVVVGAIAAGATIVCTVTGHGLKDPQWALRNADGPLMEILSASSSASFSDRKRRTMSWARSVNVISVTLVP